MEIKELKTAIIGACYSDDFTTEQIEILISIYRVSQLDEGLDFVIQSACIACGVSRDKVQSKSRKQDAVMVRNLICYYYSEKGINDEDISTIINRDRTTVLHSIKTFKNDLKQNFKPVTEAYNKFIHNINKSK